MTETARKTLEEIRKKMLEDLQKKADGKTVEEACNEAMEALAILSNVINKVVEEKTDDFIISVGSMAITGKMLDMTKAISVYKQLYEQSEIVKEQKAGKNK